MIDQGQIDLILNHRMFFPGAAVAGSLLLFIVFKFLVGSRSSNVSRSLEDAPKSASISGKKKRGKKQRTVQEKKGSDSPKLKKDSRKNEIDSLIETDKRSLEEGKTDKRKDGKSRTKSKKKKNSQSKVESIPEPRVIENTIDSGEWKTVSTKEQREQLKREKRKLDETTGLTLDSAFDKQDLEPLVQPFIKPTPNISAIAKGIAPRFARAAGEQWQEKPTTIASSMPLLSKRPMPPATIPVAVTKQPSSRSTTVNQQPWAPGNPGKQYWPTELGTTWPNSTVATSASNLTSDLMGMSSWPNTDTTTLLSMATSSEKVSVAGWPQGSSTWQPSGSPAGNNMTWDISTEDWVHVNGQNGRTINMTTDSWVGGGSPIRTQTTNQKVEEWTLEPEGFPLAPPQLDPNDPWNLEVIGSVGAGDWSAPASSWENTNAEWTAPQPVAKSVPTYFDESSGDERISSKIVSNQSNTSSVSTAPQSVVGASPEFINQAVGQGQNKKSRRRRKKKNPSSEPEQLSTPETETPKPLTSEAKPDVEPSIPKAKETQEVKEDWTVPKASKKRKSKARKAD